MKNLSAEEKWRAINKKIQTLGVFEPCRYIIDNFDDEWPSLEKLNHIFKKYHFEIDLKFVEQKVKPSRKKNIKHSPTDASLLNYIDKIFVEKEVPVRKENIHDFFNYLTFIMFPETKRQLMKIHFEETKNFSVSNPAGGRGRTRLQDFLTLFDEGGAIKLGPLAKDFIVFGHGVYEQFAVNPNPVRCMTWHHSKSSGLSTLMEIDELMSESIKDPSVFENPAVFCGVWVPEELVLPQIP